MAAPSPDRRDANLAHLNSARRTWSPEVRAEFAILLVAELAPYVQQGAWRAAVTAANAKIGQTDIYDALPDEATPPGTVTEEARRAALAAVRRRTAHRHRPDEAGP